MGIVASVVVDHCPCSTRGIGDATFSQGHACDYYELDDKVLGAGTFGHVVLGKTRGNPEQVIACKVITIAHVADGQVYPLFNEDDIRQIETEIALTKWCSHPNIVKTLAAYLSAQVVEIVMEAATGGEVAQDFSERGMYNEHDTRAVVAQLAEALKYIHRRGIVHRDVKLENVLFADSAKQTVKLVDFGFAQKVPTDDADDRDHACHRMVGTLPFMAPELFEGAIDQSRPGEQCTLRIGSKCLQGYGPKVDVWAMGIFTYLLLTGELPFEGKFLKDYAKVVSLGFEGFPDNAVTQVLSIDAKSFVHDCLAQRASERLDAVEAAGHAWMNAILLEPLSRIPSASEPLKRTLDSHRLKLRACVNNVIAQKRMAKMHESA